MGSCGEDILSGRTQKACSGKCKSGDGCGALLPRVWVIAACDGMLSLFEKHDGGLKLSTIASDVVSSSVDDFRQTLLEKTGGGANDRLVLVGSAGDISWARISLPQVVEGHIVAEIQYPLMARWFRQKPMLETLTQAIEHLF